MAGEGGLERKGPPSTYHLDEISIVLTLHPGSPAFSITRLSLSGSGSGLLERDGNSAQFPFAKKVLLTLVNELYKIRFFELPSDYTTQYSIVLNDDGIISTSISGMPDDVSTSVCFFVIGYKKCVTYSRQGPLELENMIRRVFAEALTWSSQR